VHFIHYNLARKSKNSVECSKLLKQALQQPGVEDIAKLFQNYNEVSKQMNLISNSINPGSNIITSNSSS